MEKKSCFIIMPYSKMSFNGVEYKEETLGYIYNDVIKVAVSEYRENDKIVFSDITRYDSRVGSIISGIANNLNKSDLVIADLTGLNPNVMYELGVRHTLKRGTIIISQDVASLPSDLRDYMCVEYKYSDNTIAQKDNLRDFKQILHNTIHELFSTDKFDSPVLSYLKGKEKYWKEDEVKEWKENTIVILYIYDQINEIRILLNAIKKNSTIYANLDINMLKINALIGNLSSAVGDLKIPLESSDLYEKISAAKATIQEIGKNSTLTDYFTGFISSLSELTNENDRNTFDRIKANFFHAQYIDYFKLNDGELTKISFYDIFSKNGDFYNFFNKELENFQNKKAKELGMNESDLPEF